MNPYSGMVIIGRCGNCGSPVFAYATNHESCLYSCVCRDHGVMQPSVDPNQWAFDNNLESY